MKTRKFGLYIHVPFCKKACHYCGFHFSTNLALKKQIVDSIVQEIYLKSRIYYNATLSTIYFGGGTPSILEIEELDRIKQAIYENFSIEKNNIEKTIEMNPDDISEKKLVGLKKIGFNRLSIGVQSFNNNVLKFINRSHDSKTALKCVDLARNHGFHNLNLDIIFALPKSSPQILQEDLEIIKKILPDHLSIYCLTIEEKTVFKNWLEKKIISEASEERVMIEYNLICTYLKEMNYTHYEVSNFSKKGFASLHNSTYWNHKKGYIGIGPSAHSYDLETRRVNVKNNFQYIKSLKEGIIPETIEILTKDQKINEYIMTSLRTMEGCSLTYLQKHFQHDLSQQSPIYEELINRGYLKLIDNCLIPTETGMILADEMAKKLWK